MSPMIVDKKKEEDEDEGEPAEKIEEKKTNAVGPTTFEAIEEAEIEPGIVRHQRAVGQTLQQICGSIAV